MCQKPWKFLAHFDYCFTNNQIIILILATTSNRLRSHSLRSRHHIQSYHHIRSYRHHSIRNPDNHIRNYILRNHNLSNYYSSIFSYNSILNNCLTCFSSPIICSLIYIIHSFEFVFLLFRLLDKFIYL